MPHGMHALNAQHRMFCTDAVHRMHLTGCTTSDVFHMDVLDRMHCIGYNDNDNVVFRYYNKQDAREAMRVVFSVLTKCICMHKTNFLRIYSNIVLKVILNCMNMQFCNSANYDV